MSKKKYLALAVALGLGMGAALPSVEAADQTRAQQDLQAQQQYIQQQAGSTNAEVKLGKMTFDVGNVSVTGNNKMSEKSILRLVPELRNKTVNVRTLSKQIQLVNDNGAMHLTAYLHPGGSGKYDVEIKTEELKSQHVNVGISNTGNDYTGDWRLTASYIDSNISHSNDSLGIAFVTSPAGGHWSDVRQAALQYRLPLPKHSDSFVFNASYSDVDLGSVYNYPGLFDLSSSGKSNTVGMHFQHNYAYSAHEKDIIDIGVDHKKYENKNNWHFASSTDFPVNYDFSVNTAGLTFIHNDRNASHSFTYSLGYVKSFAGDQQDLEAATPGSDSSFDYWTAGINYVLSSPSDWRMALRVHGQYSSDDLVSTEQIGAGGIYSVRGYDERVLGGDTGVVGSLEVYSPEFAKHQRALFFVDAGNLRNNNDRNTLFTHDELASSGIGYRYTADNLYFALDYVFAMSDPDCFDRISHPEHKRWNVMMNASF